MATTQVRRVEAGTLIGTSLDALDGALKTSKRSVSIAAPFLSLPVAQLMVRATRFGSPSERRFLTALTEPAIDGGYLDPWAIEVFLGEFEVRSLLNLHAKAVLVDGEWGLIGSGNLTEAGSNGGNAELGVVLSAGQAADASDIFEKWWKTAEEIDPDYVKHLRNRIRGRPPARDRRKRGQGGFFPEEPGHALDLYRSDPRRSGYWLKIMHHTAERAKSSTWKRTRWVTDVHADSPKSSQRKPNYAVGDLLVIYLARRNGSSESRRACPAILRVTGAPRPNTEPLAERADSDEERWAWKTPVEYVAATPLKTAPTLEDIGVMASSVRRHSRIRLSPESYRRAWKAIDQP